jgi:hypothetical protein
VLGELGGLPQFAIWQPDHPKEWFEYLDRGGNYPPEWPLILRPAVTSERPAECYIEDGSGRAICFFRRLFRTRDYTSRAYGHVGVIIWTAVLSGELVPRCDRVPPATRMMNQHSR